MERAGDARFRLLIHRRFENIGGKMPGKSEKKRKPSREKRSYFFLNPYTDAAFTKCPKCENKTKLRKFPLVIHIDPLQLFVLNKKCRFCTGCDLIIVKQAELEALMAAALEPTNPEVIGNEYLVFGTVERRDWKETDKGAIGPSEIMECMYVFKDVWNFELVPAGWYSADKNKCK